MLNAIIIPGVKRIKEKNISAKNPQKGSIRSAMNSFIQLLDCTAEFDNKIQELQKELAEEKQKFQPIILVVGKAYSQISEFYIYFGNKYYKKNTYLACIDLCFKIFQVFNLEYPTFCYGPWLFIQKYFFDINTDNDKNISKLLGLLNYLKQY